LDKSSLIGRCSKKGCNSHIGTFSHFDLFTKNGPIFSILDQIFKFKPTLLNKKVVFFVDVSLILSYTSKISKKLPSGDLFYLKIQKQKISVSRRKFFFFSIGPSNPPRRPNSLMVWIFQKKYFSIYVI
jgi:hypothetical protein